MAAGTCRSALVAGLAWLLRLGWRAPSPAAARWPPARWSGCMIWGMGLLMQQRAAPAGYPEVALVALKDGQPATLAQAARGRPVVVNLWASWCGPCRVEMPDLADAQRRHPDIGFLFVNQGESAEKVQAFLTRSGLALDEVWLDQGSRLGQAIRSPGLPTTVFLDAQGRQVDAHFGVLSAASLQTRVEALRRAVPSISAEQRFHGLNRPYSRIKMVIFPIDRSGHGSYQYRSDLRACARASAPAQPHAARNHLFHDLVRAAVDALHARVGVGAGDRVFPHVAVAAEELHAFVHHLALQVGAPVLGHAGGRGVELVLADQFAALVDEDARHLHLGLQLGQGVAGVLERAPRPGRTPCAPSHSPPSSRSRPARRPPP